MTDSIAEIRARVARRSPSIARDDAETLLTTLEALGREIERLKGERGVICLCGARYWDDGRACTCDARIDAAYRAGAEAMREACAVEAEQHDLEAEPGVKGGVLHILARDIRALPIPEAKR